MPTLGGKPPSTPGTASGHAAQHLRTADTRGTPPSTSGQHSGHAAEYPGAPSAARRRGAQIAVWPPSTTSVCPVMNDDASLARNTAGPAISSALAHRPIGIVAVRPA